MNKLLTILGAIALTFTLSMAAEGKCGEGKCSGDMNKTEKKCSGDKKDMKKKCADGKCAAGKCSADMKKATPATPEKGKCGKGKCGS